MSKYRIEVTSSSVQNRIFCVISVLSVSSVFIWQGNIIPYQLAIQCVMAMLIGVYCFYYWRSQENEAFTVQVHYSGEWYYLDGREAANWCIGEHSKIIDGLLWVQLIPLLEKNNSSHSSSHWCWIFRDRVNERDYRRLCRCILAVQQGAYNPSRLY